MNFIIPILTYVILLTADPWYDAIKSDLHQIYLNHRTHTIVAAVAYLIVSFVFVYTQLLTIDEGVFALVMVFGLRWPWHDMVINIVKKRPYDHLNTSEYAAKLDKFLLKMEARGVNQFAIKGILLVACMLLSFGILESELISELTSLIR